MDKEKIIAALYTAQDVYCDPEKPLKGGAGLYQPIYLDHRNLFSFPEERGIIIEALAAKLPSDKNYLIAGNETAGIALASLLAGEVNRPLVYIRKEKKPGGTGKQIEGVLFDKSPVVVVDDMMVTGGNIERALKVISQAGGQVVKAVVISVVRPDLVREKFDLSGLPVDFLVSFAEIVNWGKEHNKFNSKQLLAIEEYLSDPMNWGERHGFV